MLWLFCCGGYVLGFTDVFCIYGVLLFMLIWCVSWFWRNMVCWLVWFVWFAVVMHDCLHLALVCDAGVGL